MKKLFLLLLTIASTNVLFGIRPQQQRLLPIAQHFIVHRANQTAQNNTPAQRNQGDATRPLDRRNTTDPRMAPFLNDFQFIPTVFPRTLPAPQDNNLFLNRMALADFSDSDSNDAISSISGTENRDNNNRDRTAPTPAPMARFMNDFQVRTINRPINEAAAANILAQLRNNQ